MTDPSGPGYPAEWEADVLLRDGHPVHLRPITPGDAERLRKWLVTESLVPLMPALDSTDVRQPL